MDILFKSRKGFTQIYKKYTAGDQNNQIHKLEASIKS